MSVRSPRKRPGNAISPHTRVVIAKFAKDHSPAQAVAHANDVLGVSVAPSTVRKWRDQYKEQLTEGKDHDAVDLASKRGRPKIFNEAQLASINEKLLAFRTAGGHIDKHVMAGFANSAAREAEIDGWEASPSWCYQTLDELGFTDRAVTSNRARPPGEFEEAKSKFVAFIRWARAAV